MAHLYDLPSQHLQFYTTAPYPCSYLPGLEARSQVVTPGPLVGPALFSRLVTQGFRRSGLFTYRPHCDRCRACTPVRVDVAAFTPNRSQRRAWLRHENLTATLHPLVFQEEHHTLYERYQQARHTEGEAVQDGREQYVQFLLQSTVDTQLVEFREQGVLRMVSLIDNLDEGLSSVYTFYDPDFGNASFGTYNILWQIERCRLLGMPWLYLGYWIENSRKMDYKIRFQPLQGLLRQRWEALPDHRNKPR